MTKPQKDELLNMDSEECISVLEALPPAEIDYELIGILARAYNNSDQEAKAKKLLLTVKAEGENDGLWNYRMGYSCFYLYQYKEALAYLERAKELGCGDWADELLPQCKTLLNRAKPKPVSPLPDNVYQQIAICIGVNNMTIELFREITNHKRFHYKVQMATILFNKQEAYEALEKEASESMLPEGQPSAICENVFTTLIDTNAWYLPDKIKFWDRRFGQLFERPFFTFDDDEATWSSILSFYRKFSTPQKEDYSSTRVYNRDWEFFAEMLAVAKRNSHPQFEESYQILKERGLPEKVFSKKQEELERFCNPDSQQKYGIDYLNCSVTAW